VAPFDIYSGYLTVPGPFEQSNYTSLKIHYQFHASQNDPKTDPIASWHQGGPGSDSIAVGLYTEMGYFQVDSNGTYVNEHAWNNVASMLYLESPAGSGGSSGFSECIVADKPVDCYWNDTSQAEAYAHSLTSFFDAFPEYKHNDFYLTVREFLFSIRSNNLLSLPLYAYVPDAWLRGCKPIHGPYAGMFTRTLTGGVLCRPIVSPSVSRLSWREYTGSALTFCRRIFVRTSVPNIAHYILDNGPFASTINLKGFAIGNACWGGNETKVNCNGPNHAQMMSDIYFGKALSSKELYKQIQATCSWPADDLNTGADDFEPSEACEKLLGQQSQEAGPHNIYNIYDNCPRGGLKKFLKRTGLSMYDLNKALQKEMDTGGAANPLETLQQDHMLPLETLLGEDYGNDPPSDIGASTPINTHGGYPWSCGGYVRTSTLQVPIARSPPHMQLLCRVIACWFTGLSQP
jgi:hypothetical protein